MYERAALGALRGYRGESSSLSSEWAITFESPA
jgi:hypothetical protein